MTGRTLPQGAAIIVLGPGGMTLAQRLQPLLPGSEIHAPAGSELPAGRYFGRAVDHLAGLFIAGTPVVGLCAAGILIRAVAPHLADKRLEPPVVAVAEDGSVVVPLLGGHRGANALARVIAEAAGGVAAVTNAGDLRFGLALDEPPAGWRIADAERVKPVTSALLAGESVRLRLEAGNADWLGALAFTETGRLGIRITDREPAAGDADLVLHPPVLVLGVGCERGCDPAELRDLALSVLAEAGCAPAAVAAVVSIDIKADEAAVHDLGRHLGVAARFFTAEELLTQTPRLTDPSEAVFRETGCWGVAEGAALAAAGDKGTLLVPKRKSRRATCALSRAAAPLDAAAIGRAQGSLTVIGIGPGAAFWRTPEASAALAEASDIVGYSLYLDLLGPALTGKRIHASPIGAEAERARQALALAAEGRQVALVSSGDAGIYGLATLVFELIDSNEDPAWRRLAVSVAPGISALQAAAARAGAPLGHDFCAVSLSDLLTPWPVIRKRLEAAAEGDFVLALYNPRSLKRRSQLDEAKAILLSRRQPETPVVIARNLGRPEEAITVTTLGALDPEQVDMLTLLLIGSTRTRTIAGQIPRVYTPRGYLDKPESP